MEAYKHRVGRGRVCDSPILSTHSGYCIASTMQTAIESTTSPHWVAAVGIINQFYFLGGGDGHVTGVVT